MNGKDFIFCLHIMMGSHGTRYKTVCSQILLCHLHCSLILWEFLDGRQTLLWMSHKYYYTDSLENRVLLLPMQIKSHRLSSFSRNKHCFPRRGKDKSRKEKIPPGILPPGTSLPLQEHECSRLTDGPQRYQVSSLESANITFLGKGSLQM